MVEFISKKSDTILIVMKMLLGSYPTGGTGRPFSLTGMKMPYMGIQASSSAFQQGLLRASCNTNMRKSKLMDEVQPGSMALEKPHSAAMLRSSHTSMNTVMYNFVRRKPPP